MTFNWNDEKNEILKKSRNISFEEIVLLINEGKILDIIENPNDSKYPNQKMYLIDYNDYVWVVPFVKDEEKKEIFLKTIFPSRVYTKLLKGDKNERK